jgi:hypothetical protein
MNLFQDEAIAKWMRAAPPSFNEWLEQETASYFNKMMGVDDMRLMGFYQGILGMLTTLKELRKES